jgi:hypothetical protein
LLLIMRLSQLLIYPIITSAAADELPNTLLL